MRNLHIVLTHPNMAKAMSLTTRTRFLGDLSSMLLSEKVFVMQEANEGVLSKTRADVVCEKSADVAKSLNLGDYLRLGKGERGKWGRKTKTVIVGDAVEG